MLAKLPYLAAQLWRLLVTDPNPNRISRVRKLRLAARIVRNGFLPGRASSFLEHLALSRQILAVPSTVPGKVAEFGCYKGVSTASLSLACELAGRTLVVFDSFAGLPEDGVAFHEGRDGAFEYRQGGYAGSLTEVQETIRRHGALQVCEFVPGFYSETLPSRNGGDRFVLVFEDADLESSVRDVIGYVWPRLQPGGRLYSHEATDPAIVALFPAGFVGAGSGLPLMRGGSGLGYVQRSA